MDAAVAEVGVSTAFRKTCGLHDKVRAAIEALGASDGRTAPPQVVEQDRSVLKVLRGLLEQLEDRLRECRLIEASGGEPQTHLMCQLDHIRRNLITACKQASEFVVLSQALVSEVLDFCEVTQEDKAALKESLETWKVPKRASRQTTMNSTEGIVTEPMSPTKSTAATWGEERHMVPKISGGSSPRMVASTSAFEQFLERSSMGDWRSSYSNGGHRAHAGSRSYHDEHRASRGSGVRPAITNSVEQQQLLGTKLPRHLSRGDSYPEARIYEVPESAYLFKMRAYSMNGSHHDVDAASTTSSKDWLIAAAVASPRHFRVVHDAVAVKPAGSGNSGLTGGVGALVRSRAARKKAAPWWAQPLKALASAAVSTVLVAAAFVSVSVAVEELGSKLQRGSQCGTDEVELEPDLPQLPSQQQHNKKAKKQEKKGREHQAAQQQVRGVSHLPSLFPVFPPPDASVGQG